MNTKGHKGNRGILQGEVVNRMDAERLILEGIERLGKKINGLDRKAVIGTMRQIITLGIEALESRDRTVCFEEAGWASINARIDCRKSTIRDLRYFFRKILKLGDVSDLPLRAMTTKQCREILQRAFGHSKSMYIKGRSILHSIFSYGQRFEWCDSNPVSRIELPKVQESTKEPLPITDVKRLQQTAAHPNFKDMKLSLNLMLYSGIRPTEVSRLQPEDFFWDENVVIIRPQKSKTGGGRVVPLRGIKHLAEKERVIPSQWQKRWKALRHAAGFRHWIPDVCRHTFASYHASYYNNLPKLQLEMGHSNCNLLLTRYMSPVHKKEAKQFWELMK